MKQLIITFRTKCIGTEIYIYFCYILKLKTKKFNMHIEYDLIPYISKLYKVKKKSIKRYDTI